MWRFLPAQLLHGTNVAARGLIAIEDWPGQISDSLSAGKSQKVFPDLRRDCLVSANRRERLQEP